MNATLAAATPLASTMNSRNRLLLAWPDTLAMLAQVSVGLIETWWVSHLLP